MVIHYAIEQRNLLISFNGSKRRRTVAGVLPPVCSLLQASYFIFEKMKLEGFAGSDGEVRLRTTIMIPRWAAGRVIGKGGKNVREIQRITGAMIKLPADISHDITLHQQEQQQQEQQTTDDEVTVEVFGNFIATQVLVAFRDFQRLSWRLRVNRSTSALKCVGQKIKLSAFIYV